MLDVRSEEEWAIARLKGARLIPVGELAGRLGELGRSRPLVVYCKTGVRGRRAAKLLVEAGFTEVRNLRGGIDRWAREIDPTIPRY